MQNNNTKISQVYKATARGNDEHFQVKQLGMIHTGLLSNPVLNIDHYVTSERKFEAHPHAGFSAITYVFEDSKGNIRNRDSRGDDTLIGPGDLHWTLAGSGILHDETPEPAGVPTEGIQLFVNLHPENKKQVPRVYKLKSAIAPRLNLHGASVKVVTGEFNGTKSPVQLEERFDFFDINLPQATSVSIQAFENSGGLIYVLKGAVQISSGEAQNQVRAGEYIAIAVGANAASILLEAGEDSQVLYLRGEHDEAPMVSHGPFIMNNKQDMLETIQRFQTGKMGRL